MIAYITKVASAQELAGTLHSAGERGEHKYAGRAGAGVIASNVVTTGYSDGADWSRAFDQLLAGRAQVINGVWHCEIRAHRLDPPLDDEDWTEICAEFLEAMGIGSQPWVAVRNSPALVHLVVCRVHPKGSVWSPLRDWTTAQGVCKDIAARHQLHHRDRPGSFDSETALPADPHVDVQPPSDERSQRARLVRKVLAVLEATTGQGRDRFDSGCAHAGVLAAVHAAADGRVIGYRFADADEPARTRRWFKASQLDDRLSWPQLGPTLGLPTWRGVASLPAGQHLGRGYRALVDR